MNPTAPLSWFTLPSQAAMLLCLASSLLLTGCNLFDPVRTTVQPVHVKVTDAASGQPVVGAEVLLKNDFETAHPLSKEPLDSHNDWYSLYNFWKLQPWASGVTDKRGQVDIAVKYKAIDHTRGSKPPASRDEVTAEPYLVKVKQGQLAEEQLSVWMNRGAVRKGKIYTVNVVDIQEPRYIQEPRRERDRE